MASHSPILSSRSDGFLAGKSQISTFIIWSSKRRWPMIGVWGLTHPSFFLIIVYCLLVIHHLPPTTLYFSRVDDTPRAAAIHSISHPSSKSRYSTCSFWSGLIPWCTMVSSSENIVQYDVFEGVQRCIHRSRWISMSRQTMVSKMRWWVVGAVVGREKFAGTRVGVAGLRDWHRPEEMGGEAERDGGCPARSQSGVVGRRYDTPREIWIDTGVEELWAGGGGGGGGGGREAWSTKSCDPPRRFSTGASVEGLQVRGGGGREAQSARNCDPPGKFSTVAGVEGFQVGGGGGGGGREVLAGNCDPPREILTGAAVEGPWAGDSGIACTGGCGSGGGGDYKPDVFLWLRLWLRLRQLHEEVSFKFLLQEAMLCGANYAIPLPLVWATRGNGCLKGLQSLLQLVVIVAPSRFCKPSLVVAA